jgi:hypothetical protein
LPGIDLEHEQQQKNRHGKTPKRQDSIIEDEQTNLAVESKPTTNCARKQASKERAGAKKQIRARKHPNYTLMQRTTRDLYLLPHTCVSLLSI